MTPESLTLTTAARAEDLPDPQRLALESLLSGHSRPDAASHAGVSERTLRRWLRDPLFHAALRQARCEEWTHVTSHLQHLSQQAVAALQHVLESDCPRAQVYAARTVLMLTMKAIDLEALCGRAAQVEADVQAYLQSQATPTPAAGSSNPNTGGSTPPANTPPTHTSHDPTSHDPTSHEPPLSPSIGRGANEQRANEQRANAPTGITGQNRPKADIRNPGYKSARPRPTFRATASLATRHQQFWQGRAQSPAGNSPTC